MKDKKTKIYAVYSKQSAGATEYVEASNKKEAVEKARLGEGVGIFCNGEFGRTIYIEAKETEIETLEDARSR